MVASFPFLTNLLATLALHVVSVHVCMPRWEEEGPVFSCLCSVDAGMIEQWTPVSAMCVRSALYVGRIHLANVGR